MAYKNRYFKTLPGRLYSFIGITGPVEYSALATYILFAETSVSGEVGVYNAASGALISGAGNVSATLPIFIAVNQGGTVKKTKTFRYADVKATRLPYQAPVKGTYSLVFSAATPAAGDEVAIKVLDLTAGSHSMNSFEFRYVCKAGDTIDMVGAALAALINDTTGIALRDRDTLVTATYTSGTNTLLITNKDFGTVTKVLAIDKASTWASAAPTVVASVLGSGTVDEAQLFEEVMNIGEGVHTNYPAAGTLPEDYGKPVSNIVAGAQYNHYTFQLVSEDNAKIVDKVQYWPDSFDLLVNANGAANAEAEIKLIFAL
jgi:hypothetical protein